MHVAAAPLAFCTLLLDREHGCVDVIFAGILVVARHRSDESTHGQVGPIPALCQCHLLSVHGELHAQHMAREDLDQEGLRGFAKIAGS